MLLSPWHHGAIALLRSRLAKMATLFPHRHQMGYLIATNISIAGVYQ